MVVPRCEGSERVGVAGVGGVVVDFVDAAPDVPVLR
jgi:hypothetical protein